MSTQLPPVIENLLAQSGVRNDPYLLGKAVTWMRVATALNARGVDCDVSLRRVWVTPEEPASETDRGGMGMLIALHVGEDVFDLHGNFGWDQIHYHYTQQNHPGEHVIPHHWGKIEMLDKHGVGRYAGDALFDMMMGMIPVLLAQDEKRVILGELDGVDFPDPKKEQHKRTM